MRYATKKTRSVDRGISLLEFVIYLGMLGFVLTAAVLFSVEFVTAEAKSSAISDVARGAGYALERIAHETRASDGINFDDSVFGSNPGTLSIKSAITAADPTVFSVVDGRLYVQWGTGTPVQLTPSGLIVEEFVLEDVSTRPRFRSVRVRLTVASSGEGQTEAYSSQMTLETTIRSWRNDGFSLPTP